MGQHPGIYPVPAVGVNTIGEEILYLRSFFQKLYLILKIIRRIGTVEQDIKRKFIFQQRILPGAEHQGDGRSHQSQCEKRGQGSQSKLHGADLSRKLPEQKQVLSLVDPFAALSDIADDPGGEADIKQIDRKDQPDQKQADLDVV